MRPKRSTPTIPARRPFLAMLIATLACSTPPAEAATLAVANNRFAVRADSTRSWTEDDPPTSSDAIRWWTGPNLADDKRYLRSDQGSETKFRFSFSGSLLTPPGKDFTGFAPGNADLVQGPGSLGSTCVTHGHGKSYGNAVGDETTYFAEWHLLADGHITSQPAGGPTPQWFSTSRAEDPICIRLTDFDPIGPGETVDLTIPIQLGPGSLGHGGWHVHVSYETAEGAWELGNVFIGADGVDVMPGSVGSGTLRFYLPSAFGPPAAGDAPQSPSDVAGAIGAQSSTGAITTPIDLSIDVRGASRPTTDMGDGTVAKIHVDSDCWDRNSASGVVLRTLSQRLTAEDGAGMFVIPEDWPCAQLAFDPSPPGPGQRDASVMLYGLAGPSWVLLDQWQWNAGLTRIVVPTPGIEVYRVVDSSVDPDLLHIDLPVWPQPPSPFGVATLPDFTLGGVDFQSNPFNVTLGAGAGGYAPPVQIQPGLPLQNIPRCLGANHWQYLPVQFNVQSDPSRPWLYVNGNPSQGFARPTTLTLGLDGLFDAFGGPIQTLPVEVDFYQGATQRFFQGNAQRQQDGRIVFPIVNLGPMLPQPYAVVIGVPDAVQATATPWSAACQEVAASGLHAGAETQAAPGFFSMNGVAVANGVPTVTGVDPSAQRPAELQLSVPCPNPCASGTSLAFATPARGPVSVRIFDLGGREVRTLVDGMLDPGRHEVRWDGRDARATRAVPGIYFASVRTGEATVTRKITLIP